MWFRIEVAKDGSIVSCEHVEASQSSRGDVRFVEANSKADAIGLVQAWYARKRDSVLRIARYTSKGLCACSRPRDTSAKLCSSCRKQKRDARARAKLRTQGRADLAPLRHRAPAITDAARAAAEIRAKASRAESIKIRRSRATSHDPITAERRVLEAALHAFDTLSANDFRAWLVTEIQKRAPRSKERSEFLQSVLDQHAAE